MLPTRSRSRLASIVGLIVALGAPFLLPFLPGHAHARITDVAQDIGIAVFEWIVAIALPTIVIFWERLPLRSIGFRGLSPRDGVAMAVAFVGMFIGIGIVAALTRGNAIQSSSPTPAEVAAVPLALRIVLCLTAGFCEELMLRGYAIERLASFTGKYWVGGVVAVVLFTLAHIPRYGYTSSLLDVAVVSTLLTALYIYTRNFFAVAILHAFIDFIGLVLTPAFAARAFL
jgi:membrane protease YdiL (CAAX protease family)